MASQRWAVAVSLSKQVPVGLNVHTSLHIVVARSEAESVGIAIPLARETAPEHMIGHIVSVEIPDA